MFYFVVFFDFCQPPLSVSFCTESFRKLRVLYGLGGVGHSVEIPFISQHYELEKKEVNTLGAC